MASSPLQTYKAIATEFGIGADQSVHPRQKLAFFSEQVNQQKAIANRLLGDLAHARLDIDTAQDAMTKAAYRQRAAKYEDDLRQIVQALNFSLQMEKELSAENPGVETTPADHPEGS